MAQHAPVATVNFASHSQNLAPHISHDGTGEKTRNDIRQRPGRPQEDGCDIDVKIAAELLQKLSEWLRRDSHARSPVAVKSNLAYINCSSCHSAGTHGFHEPRTGKLCIASFVAWQAEVTQQLCIKFRLHGAIVNLLTRHYADIDVARAGPPNHA